MSKIIAASFAFIVPLIAAIPAAASEATLLCRFSKFTITESTGAPGRMRTLREVSLSQPRSILVAVNRDSGRVSSPQANMLIEKARLSGGQLAAHIRYMSDRSWLFGEEVDGRGVLIIDLESNIGSVMAQLKSADTAKLALSAGLCREYRMQQLTAVD